MGGGFVRFVLFFLCLGGGVAQDVRHLTILHTSDLHARLLPDDQGRGGLAYVAAALRQERNNCAGCLVLDGGDLVQGTPVSTLFRGLPVYEIANSLGIDVSTLGNHEFDYGWRRIYDFVSTANFPVVNANVVNADGAYLTGKPYTIVTVNGIRIGIIGAVMGGLLDGFTTPDLLGPWKVMPVVDAVNRFVVPLRERTDFIILLAHITHKEMDEVLQKVPEVGLVVAGHEHGGLGEMKRVDGRLGVRVRAYGREIGRLDLEMDVTAKKVTSAYWKKVEVTERLTPVSNISGQVREWEGKVAKAVDTPIGEAKRTIPQAEVRVMIEQSMKEATGADFAFMNRGGVRDVLPKGTILARNIWNIMPFDNRLMVGRFKGKDLPKVVTEGHPVEPEREYRLVVSDFTVVNQKTQLGTTGLEFPQAGPLMRDAIIDWVKKQRVIE
ncbi:MAG: bifunctional metallophosphatase/5'-nucleotidase [Bryobacterales bacterium]|nr:bifunctional metallophosphatase/5'-nucleotidase [Bryobacterales bacterium]